MNNTWRIALTFFCIAAVLIGGCTDAELGVVTPTSTTAPPTAAVTVPATVVSMSIPTTKLTPPITTAPLSGKPLEKSPLILSGIGDQILRFDVRHPGKVKFDFRYSSYYGTVENCRIAPVSLTLAGPSVDIVLSPIMRNVIDGTKTVNLPMAGGYTLTTKGCYGWKVNLTNA